MIAGPVVGMLLDAGDVEAGVREQRGSGEAAAPAAAARCRRPGSFGDARAARRGASDRPAPGGGHAARIRGSGLTTNGWPTADEQRRVVDAVGVGVALGEVDAVLVGPLAHRGELAGAPHERAVERAVVGAVGVDAVAGGDDVVEAEQVGERLDQVVGRRGGQHDRATGGAVLVEQAPRRTAGPAPTSSAAAAARPPAPPPATGPWPAATRLAGERHRRQRLADRVEQPGTADPRRGSTG